MKTLIKNGRIVTAVDDYRADILIEDEQISVIGKTLDMEADLTIDASGKIVRHNRAGKICRFNFARCKSSRKHRQYTKDCHRHYKRKIFAKRNFRKNACRCRSCGKKEIIINRKL